MSSVLDSDSRPEKRCGGGDPGAQKHPARVACGVLLRTCSAVCAAELFVAQLWYGSALSSVTLTMLPLGTLYSRVSPTVAPISAAPSGELGE